MFLPSSRCQLTMRNLSYVTKMMIYSDDDFPNCHSDNFKRLNGDGDEPGRKHYGFRPLVEGGDFQNYKQLVL